MLACFRLIVRILRPHNKQPGKALTLSGLFVSFHVCVFHVCVFHVCAFHVCAFHACAFHVCSLCSNGTLYFKRLRPCLRAQAARCCSASRCAARIELPSPSSGNKRKQPPTATDRSFGMLVAAGPVRLSKSGGCQCHRETPAPAGRRDNPIRR